ncbi:MAG: hypothetical protein JOZ32_12230 [Bryobacterales bacterium]|nr:hypothetical protein [Bryobacterales bacterium]
MPTRVAHWFALALAAFLLVQPIPFLAFASSADNMPCGCKDGSMSCCRRSHGHSSGPVFSSRNCCEQCHVSVRQSRPVAESVAPTIIRAEVAPIASSPIARFSWIPSALHQPALFERPPPFAV